MLNINSRNDGIAGFENIDGLMSAVELQGKSEIQDSMSQSKRGLHLIRDRLKHFRSLKLLAMESQLKATKPKDKLSARFNVLQYAKAMTSAEKWLRTASKQNHQTIQTSDRVQNRINHILSDLDQSQSGALNLNSKDSPVAMNSTVDSLASAAKTEAGLVHDLNQKNLNLIQDQYSEMNNSYNQAQGKVQQQQSTMKRAGLFGKLFQVAYQTVMTAVSVFAAPLGPIAQKAIQGVADVLMTAAGTGMNKNFQNQMANQQIHEQNQNGQVSFLQNNINQNLQDGEKQAQRLNQSVMTLESAGR